MTDPRITKLADVLTHYSMAIKPADELVIIAPILAEELVLAVYEAAIKAGAHVNMFYRSPAQTEIFLKYANDDQLAYISPVFEMVVDRFDAILQIMAPQNTRALSGVDAAQQQKANKANGQLFQRLMERLAKKEVRTALTNFPTHASAQDADMSLREYEEFVYNAGNLNHPDPVEMGQAVEEQQQKIIDWLAGKQTVILKGSNIDMTMSITDRNFVNACGKVNFPDGEIFTSPVENSAAGWVRFGYPAIYGGREVEDIELWFEEGKVVQETAKKGQDFLTSTLNTDDNARILGELGIGTNYNIQRFTKNMLYDEKIGGTVHLAVGMGFPEAAGNNQSAIHWDMLCDMADGEILVDGELFYKDGKFVI